MFSIKRKKKFLLATPPKSLLYYLEETQVWHNKKIYLALLLVSKIFGISWIERVIVPWTIRRSNQSILKEISPEYLLEELMLKLKLQYFGHLMERTDSLEKTLMLGKIEGRRRWGWQRMSWLDWHEFEQALGVGVGQGSLECCSPWGHKESDTTEWLNWCGKSQYSISELSESITNSLGPIVSVLLRSGLNYSLLVWNFKARKRGVKEGASNIGLHSIGLN